MTTHSLHYSFDARPFSCLFFFRSFLLPHLRGSNFVRCVTLIYCGFKREMIKASKRFGLNLTTCFTDKMIFDKKIFDRKLYKTSIRRKEFGAKVTIQLLIHRRHGKIPITSHDRHASFQFIRSALYSHFPRTCRCDTVVAVHDVARRKKTTQPTRRVFSLQMGKILFQYFTAYALSLLAGRASLIRNTLATCRNAPS